MGLNNPYILFPQAAICRLQALPQMDQWDSARSGQEAHSQHAQVLQDLVYAVRLTLKFFALGLRGTLAMQINLSVGIYLQQRKEPSLSPDPQFLDL